MTTCPPYLMTLTLCGALFGSQMACAAPDRTPGTIRIATYNIENLFDNVDDLRDHGRYDDMHDDRKGLRAKPDSELEAVAKAIRESDADIIGLQEIESYDALKAFVTRYLGDMGYDFIVSIDVNHARFIEQAIISRFPIKEATVWPDAALGGIHPEMYGDQPNWEAGKPILYRRSPVRAVIEVPAEITGAEPYRLTMFVVHHKSGRHSSYWRERESTWMVDRIQELQQDDPDRNIVVLGDFNAMTQDASVQTYLSSGMTDTHAGPNRPATHESGRVIDLILVNGAMAGEVVKGSAFVHRTPVRPEGADWRTTPEPAGFASDHLLTGVDIRPQDQGK